MEHIVKILSIHNAVHDVKVFRVAKPLGYVFEPGQATEVSINQERWRDEKRPFTFTSLNEWPYLEFTIKIYQDHDGVTKELNKLRAGDEVVIGDPWGAITYHGEGYFIAGGAGITPFIAIFRQLKKVDQIGSNQLYFSNKIISDIILKEELNGMLGMNVHHIITDDAQPFVTNGYINKAFLADQIKDRNKPVYICGPESMVRDMRQALAELGISADAIIFEK